MSHAIEVRDLRKSFRRTPVLDGVTLTVAAGKTYAFLGRNGAGKTTTIRTLLGLLRPDGGSVRVLGLDPVRDAIEVRRRVGYLAEDQQMWGWMRVKDILSFMAPFYPSWDMKLAREYAERWELALTTRIKHLSKGQGVRLGLLLALAHRPELVILDDPVLGLDPIMRKSFLRDVVDHLQGRGMTVFFSSHLLYEVEPVADTVAILDRGRVVREAGTDELREQVKRLIFDTESFREARRAGVPLKLLDVRATEREVVAVVDEAPAALRALAPRGLSPRVLDLNLDEIFEAFVIGKPGYDNGDAAAPALERVA